MGFGLYSLLEAGLLVLNAITILHEERFLNKFGLGRNAEARRRLNQVSII
ncbi:immediate early response 3-interacting protein 1-like [Tropilaelaps mercedesae]|uniref:Immediate early response 3-interacting protein 1 n=1 Tax=Tropilaelaps mercedesae TaxID=418985 RepID=A0A1V9X7D9_9ACAR|nr:immediate early response 3-interacting protein 1-like [Tropilaelaps mercedesae]